MSLLMSVNNNSAADLRSTIIVSVPSGYMLIYAHKLSEPSPDSTVLPETEFLSEGVEIDSSREGNRLQYCFWLYLQLYCVDILYSVAIANWKRDQ